MSPQTRESLFRALFPDEPAYRWKQVEQALFTPNAKGWEDVKTLPKAMRETLIDAMPWITCRAERMYRSHSDDTFKAVLIAADGKRFESVLMLNKRGQWTICVSSQIGCAMKCTFCATGAMGFKRSLTSDEIMDQYRFWQAHLRTQPSLATRISNVVFMGMGEPMTNYDNVKKAIHTWLEYTDIGPTRITVSTVGVIMQMEKLLTDDDWPPVRVAVSLHSANQQRREEIVPTTVPEFLKKLADWSHRYAKLKGNQRHHITYEYTLITGVNDTLELAHELGRYIRKTAASKINLIPYNPVAGKTFSRSSDQRIDAFKQILRDYGLDVTQRKTMGDDIAAACGQLITETPAETEAKDRGRIVLDMGRTDHA
ncbi:MAG: 23S rRNA (adenine(2503)-C(2))-methyltransferase RlmN [Candidatus Peregrinibacteria bacterium]|nr:23S rRNA (adenine(2503)-C(2))-methyltransferase RlmN [Candidatus Peregrinibacteria bacterium]